MHFLEQYALNCGVKIDKPIIYESFFPLNCDKYICFHPSGKYDSRTYDYWQIVLDFIIPVLHQHKISVVQIGGKGEHCFANCIHTNGKTTINQAAYIIKNSILNLGADSFSSHIASGFGKKIVALYSNNNINNCRPYWTNSEDSILIASDRNGKKPSYSEKEYPKTINNIKPEEIAKAVFKLLKIEDKISIKSIFIGDKYSPSTKFIEVVPNGLVDPTPFKIKTFNIRMDLAFNQENLFKQSKLSELNIITDKPIDLNLLKSIKSQIKGILYLITENDSPEFAKAVVANGINLQIASTLPPNELTNKKINYMDLGIIGEINEKDLSLFKGKNFKSAKCLISEGKIYPSTHYFKLNKPAPNFEQHSFVFENGKDDALEADFFYIFES